MVPRFTHSLIVGSLAVLLTAGSTPKADQVRPPLHLTVQGCHDDDFELLFDDEARASFDSCDVPFVDFDVKVTAAGVVLADAISDENGEVVFESIDLGEHEVLRLIICKENGSCFKLNNFLVFLDPDREGGNFILYRDGYEDETVRNGL